jgi:hypothetical protein
MSFRDDRLTVRLRDALNDAGAGDAQRWMKCGNSCAWQRATPAKRPRCGHGMDRDGRRSRDTQHTHDGRRLPSCTPVAGALASGYNTRAGASGLRPATPSAVPNHVRPCKSSNRARAFTSHPGTATIAPMSWRLSRAGQLVSASGERVPRPRLPQHAQGAFLLCDPLAGGVGVFNGARCCQLGRPVLVLAQAELSPAAASLPLGVNRQVRALKG